MKEEIGWPHIFFTFYIQNYWCLKLAFQITSYTVWFFVKCKCPNSYSVEYCTGAHPSVIEVQLPILHNISCLGLWQVSSNIILKLKYDAHNKIIIMRMTWSQEALQTILQPNSWLIHERILGILAAQPGLNGRLQNILTYETIIYIKLNVIIFGTF